MLTSLIGLYRVARTAVEKSALIEMARRYLSQDSYKEFLTKTGAK
jgi:hypothetical protein